MAWKSSGQKQAKVTRKILFGSWVPKTSTASGIRATLGIGRRNSISALTMR